MQMARRYYNGTVRNLNISIQSFPDVLMARAVRLQGGAVLRARRRARGGGAAGRVPGSQAMSAIVAHRAGVALLFWRRSRPAGAVERILQFISDVKVERNGDLVVTETIRVQAEGREIRRGILRDFPTTYTAPRRRARGGRLRRAVGHPRRRRRKIS